jgi:hypothetical protein
MKTMKTKMSDSVPIEVLGLPIGTETPMMKNLVLDKAQDLLRLADEVVVAEVATREAVEVDRVEEEIREPTEEPKAVEVEPDAEATEIRTKTLTKIKNLNVLLKDLAAV